MPSGAKKRKAAKKKLGKKDHNFGANNNNGSHSNSQGNDDPKSRDESNSDGAFVERDGNVQGSDVNIRNEEGSMEVTAHTDDVAREFKKGNDKSSSSGSSGSSSSSDDDEIVVEKEKSGVLKLGKLEASVENSGVSEVVNEAVEESIPIEESVKQVVSLPQVSTILSESKLVDNSSTSDAVKSALKQNVDEVSQQYDDENKVASGMEKIEEKVIAVVDRGPEYTSVPVTARDDAGLLPQSSGVKAVKGCSADDDRKVSEIQKNAEEQPLLSSAPMPVRRTSWMDCCGLFEVFSGGSGR